MWNTRLPVLFGLVALAIFANGQQAYNYQPPQQQQSLDNSQYLPPEQAQDAAANQGSANQYLPPDEDRNLLPDANEGSQQIIGLEQPEQTEEHHHHHDGDHHDHHEHWDLRESIPGEPGEDYPLHHSPPDTGFSCSGRLVGYYADVQAGCQAFHVCNGDDSPPQSFLCPNGTIFNQEVFSCEWWNNVDCAASESHYEKNSQIGVVIPYKGERIPVLRVPSNLENAENDINFQPASSNEDESRLYLPPTSTLPPTTTRRPPPSSTYLPPPTTTRRPPPTTSRPTFRPIVVAELPTNEIQQSNVNNNFQGYDYPKPTTTQRPISAGPSNNLPSFSETDGYSYPNPQVGLQKPTSTTRRPVSTTRRPTTTSRPTTTRRSVVISTTTSRPINTGQSNQVPSFDETEGYNYPKPSVGLPIPTRQPVTTTRQPIASGPSNQLPSFSETDGYSYPKPSVGLPLPTTTRQPITTTRAPVTTTRAPPTTTRRPFTTQVVPIAPGASDSNQNSQGYNYPKPSVAFPLPTTTRAPVTTTRAPFTTTRAPITTTRAPPVTTTRRPVTFITSTISSGESNANQNFQGYDYPKPSVAFPVPTTSRVPVTTTRAPVTTTRRPTTIYTQPPIIDSGESNSNQNVEGYNYPKPSVAFPLPTTTLQPVTTTTTTTTRRPVISTSQRPAIAETSGYTYPKPSIPFELPATTQKPDSSELSDSAVVGGYSYPSPSIPFELPTTTRQPITVTQGQQFSAGSDDFSIASTSQPSSAATVGGYEYPKPRIPFDLPSRPSLPLTAPSENEGFSLPSPGSPFSIYQRNQQPPASNANLINQEYQSASASPPCIHTQQQQNADLIIVPNSEPTVLKQILPPVGDNGEGSAVVNAPFSLDGYDVRKPSIAFVTGTKKPLKNEVLAPFDPEEAIGANRELSGAKDYQISHQYQQPFIDGFNVAQQQQHRSASFGRQLSEQSSFNSQTNNGIVERQRSRQVANHVLEIIPSISYSYQLENKDVQQDFKPAAPPSAFKRSKNQAIY
ncbi:Hypothetical predicted protein [Cloeon dipterum]|uniref:Chitin-binding type-2 domain-containing protein n=1 Tax=Cloeon dipterum TaxID=197152 RepID=A0A8S1BZ29_9INSE|nr:Hypothetical predicted protein [Cloeon dipterum]